MATQSLGRELRNREFFIQRRQQEYPAFVRVFKGLYDTLPISRTFLRESRLSEPVIRSKENHSPFLGPFIDTADCISC
jgi:hypothetical protein